MLVSISDGFCLDGLFGAILLRAACDMIAVVDASLSKSLSSGWSWVLSRLAIGKFGGRIVRCALS